MPVNHTVLYPDQQTTETHLENEIIPVEILSVPPIIIEQPNFQETDARNNIGQQRRPIPISTQDWISTTNTHLTPISGERLLMNVEQLEIQLVVDLSTLLGQSKNGNQYRVRVRAAETLFLSMENSTRWQRNLFGSSRKYEIILRDASGELAFTLKKNYSFGFIPGFLHKIIVETNELIGSIEQNFTTIGQKFTIYDENKNNLAVIEGPNFCCCCMREEIDFHVISADVSKQQIASISYHWDHLLADNNLLLTFSSNCSIKLKSLLLGAAFLMQSLYFEGLFTTQQNY